MKINFIDTSLSHLMIHGIGNKCLEESLVLSSQEVQMNEMTTCKLLGISPLQRKVLTH